MASGDTAFDLLTLSLPAQEEKTLHRHRPFFFQCLRVPMQTPYPELSLTPEASLVATTLLQFVRTTPVLFKFFSYPCEVATLGMLVCLSKDEKVDNGKIVEVSKSIGKGGSRLQLCLQSLLAKRHLCLLVLSSLLLPPTESLCSYRI